MPIKQYEKHELVDKKYKWDLSFLLEGKTPEEALDANIKLARKQIEIKESQYNSKEDYLAALKLQDEVQMNFYKIYNYISNSINLDVSNAKALALKEKYFYESYKIDQELGATTALFYENADKVREWVKDEAFAPYRHMINATLEAQKHTLPKEIEEFRNKESRADVDPSGIFSILTNSELDYGYAENSKGEKIKLNAAMKSEISKSKDKKLRQTGLDAFKKAYVDHKGTLASLLYQHFKKETVWAKLLNHSSTIEYLTFDDRANEEMLLTLYKAVEDNMDVFQKFFDLHSKYYEAKFGEKMTKYDGGVELVEVESEYTVEQAKEMVLNAIKPFGKEYTDVLKKGLDENWVDFMPVKNKRSGAYSIGATYGIDKKLILMNYNGTLDSVSTLAHEFGHSMHSYYADKNNSLPNANYKIFVAEIASIFNELMLFDHILQNSDDDELKFKIRYEMMTGFDGTIRRQVAWSKYEYNLYKEIEQGKPYSSFSSIAKLYFETLRPFDVWKDKEFVEDEQYASVYVPHFYYGFYVYKYAIGQLVASIFFGKYKAEGPEALQEYINKFLSAGGSDFPLNILKNAGVDLNDPKTYKYGFDAARENLAELEKLGDKIFKK